MLGLEGGGERRRILRGKDVGLEGSGGRRIILQGKEDMD